MEENYSCSLCPEVAVRCCLCSNPRTYLCPSCVLQHTNKSGSHPLVPTNTPAYVTKDNHTEHDRRVTALKKLSGKLEGLSAQLAEERRALDQAFNDVYTQQQQHLYEVLSAVYVDINGYYERLHADLEAFKQDLTTAEKGVSVSQVTEKYVKFGIHIPEVHTFLDARSAMTQRLQISTGANNLEAENCLRKMMTKWNPRMCSCSDCAEFRDTAMAEWPYKSRIERQSHVFDSWDRENECQEINLACLPSQAMAETTQSLQKEQKKQIPSPGPQGAAIHEVQRRKQSTEPPTQPKTISDNPTLQTTGWNCKTCQRKNGEVTEQCSCGEYRNWKDYCSAKSRELNEAQDKWFCKMCGVEVSRRQAYCVACSKVNKDMSALKTRDHSSECQIF